MTKDGANKEMVARLVRALRGGKTQDEFGKELGVAHATICFWENGTVQVSPFNLMRLLNYAKQAGAPPEVIQELESIQPELGP